MEKKIEPYWLAMQEIGDEWGLREQDVEANLWCLTNYSACFGVPQIDIKFRKKR